MVLAPMTDCKWSLAPEKNPQRIPHFREHNPALSGSDRLNLVVGPGCDAGKLRIKRTLICLQRPGMTTPQPRR